MSEEREQSEDPTGIKRHGACSKHATSNIHALSSVRRCLMKKEGTNEKECNRKGAHEAQSKAGASGST